MTLVLFASAQKKQEPVVIKHVKADLLKDPGSPIMLAGDWVPPDPGKIDFERLPRLQNIDHVIVHDVRKFDGHRVNQHNFLAYYDGLYWVMWSDGPGVARAPAGEHRNKMPGHDQATQKVSYATSNDGLTWSEAKDITNSPAAPDGWIACGFWIRDGKLLSLVSSFKAPAYYGHGLTLHAFEFNKQKKGWDYLGIALDNAVSNFPPVKLPSGEWMMSGHDSLRNVHLLLGGGAAYNKWESVLPPEYGGSNLKPVEPDWWVLPDGTLTALFRENNKSGYLYRSFSTDQGHNWSPPVRTNFPDATSKFSGVRLKDGRYVLASNPRPGKRDPMTLAISNDGIVFNKMIYLAGGRHIDYPHIIENDGYLFIAFASAKQSVEVIRVKIPDIDKVVMPKAPLISK